MEEDKIINEVAVPFKDEPEVDYLYEKETNNEN